MLKQGYQRKSAGVKQIGAPMVQVRACLRSLQKKGEKKNAKHPKWF